MRRNKDRTMVPIRKEVRDALRRWIEAHDNPPVMTDVISNAVVEYIKREAK